MKEFYYYLRSQKLVNFNAPIVTVCLLQESNGTVLSRGTSICSFKDNPEKSTGKKIARKRAFKALYSGRSGDQVTRDEAIGVLMGTLNKDNMFPIKEVLKEIITAKSVFLPVLFPLEEKIIHNMKGGEIK